ncbi:MAG: phospholipase D-like domain-containing protein [Nitrospirota bacterium]
MLTIVVEILLALVGLLSAAHAFLNKRDPKSAWGWVAVCLMFPGGGAALYWLMGVNRIRTRAKGWVAEGRFERTGVDSTPPTCAPPSCDESITSLVRIGDTVTGLPLVGGHRITILHNGEEAFPAMLRAIDNAAERVYLSTYIFRNDAVGERFIDALTRAAQRGVDVRVLIDGVGELYTYPWVTPRLRRAKVRSERFLPLVRRGLHFNLRNHRKLLVVDGLVGFTGGMNIGAHQLAEDSRNPHRVIDLQVGVEGPVVGQLEGTFLSDWRFVTGEPRTSQPPRPPSAPAGHALCRGISAGPNEDFEDLYWLVLGALGAAQRHIRIMTPYFIPDRALLAALNTAALRGVRVDIVLPERNNLPYVAWAMRAILWEVLQYGARVYYQPGPFVHSKLLAVDDVYTMVGSANLDPRSLRLNFEFNLEIYDRDTAASLTGHFDSTRDRSREVTLADMDGRPLPERLRDAAAKLFAPYL